MQKRKVSVPLRGLDMRKRFAASLIALIGCSFSPLAGIRYAETAIAKDVPKHKSFVSVPLRGLDMRKPGVIPPKRETDSCVSVPLRGLDMRKHFIIPTHKS